MKKIALVLSLSFLIFSCSKDESSDDSNTNQNTENIENTEDEELGIQKEDLIGSWVLISSETEGDSVLDDANCDLQDNLTFTQDQFITEDFYNLGEDCYSFDPVLYEYIVKDNQIRTLEGTDGIISSLWGNIAFGDDQLIVTVTLFGGLENISVYKKK